MRLLKPSALVLGVGGVVQLLVALVYLLPGTHRLAAHLAGEREVVLGASEIESVLRAGRSALACTTAAGVGLLAASVVLWAVARTGAERDAPKS